MNLNTFIILSLLLVSTVPSLSLPSTLSYDLMERNLEDAMSNSTSTDVLTEVSGSKSDPYLAEAKTEPEVETSSEPESEGVVEADNQNKTTGDDGDDDDGCKDGCFAEPNPPWEPSKLKWGVAWEIHIYGLGIIFALMAIYSFVGVILLWKRKNLLSRGYFISLNAMLLFLCVTRAVFLLVDAYNSRGTFHPAGSYFLGSIAFPCITSAFSILFLSLLKTLKVQMLSPSIQKPLVLIAIIVAHFLLSVTTDIVVGYLYSARALVFVCQLVSIIWSLLLSFCYLYIFRQLYSSASKRQKEFVRISSTMSQVNASAGVVKPPRYTASIAIKVTFITACLGLIQAILHIYGLTEVINVFSDKTPEAWPWWGMHFGLRLTEISMCLTMGYVATQPFRHQATQKNNQDGCFGMLLSIVTCKHLSNKKDEGDKFVDIAVSSSVNSDSGQFMQ